MADITVPKAAQTKILRYVDSLLTARRNFAAFNTKLTAIDVGYYCYRAKKAGDVAQEIDIDNLVRHDKVDIPLIVSQVDSLRAYFADVYLSGFPLFPVAGADVKSNEMAEAFEALLGNHALKARYPRQLMLAFTDAAKYNFVGMEVSWDSIEGFLPDAGTDDERYHLTKLRRLDPYNTLWDYRVNPADVATDGEYAGDVQLISRNALKTKLNKLAKAKLNLQDNKTAFNSGRLDTRDGKLTYIDKDKKPIAQSVAPINYAVKPQISQYINSTVFQNGGTWEDYINTGTLDRVTSAAPYLSNMYELVTIHARIIPSEYGLKAPRANTPQVWKFEVLNGNTLLSAAPARTPHGILPTLICQPHEDGFSYQTLSPAESQLPLQGAASDLYNTRIASAKRALNDRMLYDPDMIDPIDINSSVPAAKIPVRSLRLGKRLNDAAMHLPFDGNATSGALNDMNQTIQLSYMLTGLNPFRQGQTQKGNRTLAEFDSIINFSDLRTRVLALMIEFQLMQPLKDLLKFNILTNLKQVDFVDSLTGTQYQLDTSELYTKQVELKVADGFTPKSKLMSVEDLQQALMFIQNSPVLSQQYDVGAMFAHLMSLRGVKGLKQFALQAAPQQAMPQQPTTQHQGDPNNAS